MHLLPRSCSTVASPRGEGSSRPRDSSGTPHGEYRPDIDGLRAVAVLAVVAYHTKAWVLPGGFVGVDVFFVISGFLISGIILQRLQKGTFSITDFYARRIRRIFPALSPGPRHLSRGGVVRPPPR
ncbi:MAG: acyltransferase [Gemmatimonadetes bacterium]|nr:acyltransferase [Gemmatimonadota bacterium]